MVTKREQKTHLAYIHPLKNVITDQNANLKRLIIPFPHLLQGLS